MNYGVVLVCVDLDFATNKVDTLVSFEDGVGLQMFLRSAWTHGCLFPQLECFCVIFELLGFGFCMAHLILLLGQWKG